jgi:HEPN domain-containing protein
LQALAEKRLKDAQVLYGNGRFDGAYYLAGYAVECALKACIAKKTKRHDFPPDKKLTEKIYTHDLSRLLETAGLAPSLEHEFQGDRALEVKWGIVRDWSERSRYETHGRKKSHDMLEAVGGHLGVLICIRKYW